VDEYAFWQQKLIQLFHDPLAKPFTGTPKTGKQAKVAQDLFNAFQAFNEGRKWRYLYRAADWVAAGADRPNLYTPRQKGVSPLGTIRWPNDPLVSHPLAPDRRVRVPLAHATKERENPLENEDAEPRDVLQEQLDVVTELAKHVPDWTDAGNLREGFIVLWRRLRDDLQADFPGDPLWGAMPSDSRVPDHAIWDHLKVVTALAFMEPHTFDQDPAAEGAREPWMLRMTLGPVGRFIEQSRTTRDLWLSSYLLADLAFAAMSPFIEQYGPDCIVYPDLRGNPRADCWLFEHYRAALGGKASPSTFAAILPESFVALVPRGGDGHLARVEELAKRGQGKVTERWKAYAGKVRNWFARHLEVPVDAGGVFDTIWNRQQQCPIHAVWTAVPWLPMGRLKTPESLRRPALPAQGEPPPIDADDAGRIAAREKRLKPWVPPEVWSRYEHARDVFAHSNLAMFQIGRGFDYALTHHQLSVRQALRLRTDPAPLALEEPGEKCTLCGLREALHVGEGKGDTLGARRQGARKFWSRRQLDPDESGAERLCAICATKRFLVEADGAEETIFNCLWAGMKKGSVPTYRDGRARVPFPSTGTIAAQKYLADVVTRSDCKEEVADIVRACRDAGFPHTSFSHALPRLAASGEHELLNYEAEDVLFPEALDGKVLALERKARSAESLKELRKAVKALREKTTVRQGGQDDASNSHQRIESPQTRIAVIHVDGDRMGKLLLGDEEAVTARWRDVLHPEVLNRLEKNQHLKDAGWLDLLEARRLMGPSLHAFVNRALAAFAHRIAPFVVEQEFSGRLIYAGGDDILAIAPADEAIDLAARLQQLFSSAWVVDRRPEGEPWEWRRPDWRGTYDQGHARQRFLIPLAEDGVIDLARPWRRSPHVSETEGGGAMPAGWVGELLPLLGTGASLSAGIAVGHYKTPLSVLLRRSKELLRFAKERGRSRIGFGHASRGGEKSRFALPWKTEDGQAHEIIRSVIEGFRSGDLASRLPYKLRTVTPSLCAVLEKDIDEKLCRGLFQSCLGEGSWKSTEAAAAWRLWLEGIRLYRSDLDAATDGLLFCRAMAGGGGEA
jgi:CRISPR-associated protein Cmr2